MRILADENMPAVAALFEDLNSTITTAPGRTLTPAQVREADVLLVRSVTPVTASLLADSTLRFVGSATIGTDHIDHAELQRRHIPFSHAPGCNADAVVDYVMAALLHLFRTNPEQLATKTVAVIGAGNVGGRLVDRCRALHLNVMVCDPPRAEQEQGAQCVDLNTALSADIVCCHTPLTSTGAHPTAGMLTAAHLTALPTGAVFLNAGRGGIAPAAHLRSAMQDRPDVHWVLDVWDPEPAIPRALLPHVALATGHVAGYSSEGKVRGTWMLRQALAERLNLPVTTLTPQALLPPAPAVVIDRNPLGSPWETAVQVVGQVYDIAADDQRFRSAMAGADHGVAFDHYRRTYPTRREYQSTVVSKGRQLPPDHQSILVALGFQLG